MREANVKPAKQAAGTTKPDHVIEIFLQPGDFYFGGADTRIRTVLGSCVSITMWHPTRLIGGMCHFMLPFRQSGPATAHDGRYAEEAIRMFLREIRAARTHPAEYRVKLFGAGNMFPGRGTKKSCGPQSSKEDMNACRDVACKNAAIANSLCTLHGFTVGATDMGGEGHRQVIFDVWSGHVWVRKPAMQSTGGPLP